MRIYLDNAATTPLDPEVIDAMLPFMKQHFGNPSSIHSYGREVKSAIEQARKKVAAYFNVTPSEIFFTSGGTEANNTAIHCSVRDLGIKHIITSRIEHHAVLHTVEELEKQQKVKVSFVRLAENGHVDLEHLETLLADNNRSLVSLMHANNEIGNLLPIEKVALLCAKYDAVFHCDTVQTVGHYEINLREIPVHFISCASHKFHGPKGVGFLYVNNKIKIHPFIYGGSQERNMRGGTENVYGIIGLSKALEIAYANLDEHWKQITSLKEYMAESLTENIPGINFNGDCMGKSLYTVLNVCFPVTDFAEMLLFNLDIAGIAASGGSACSSGSESRSHVLEALGVDEARPCVRFSFSKYNTKEEIDFCVEKLKELYAIKVA
ncbi:MAG TPA: cysteine desulfurase family protein [Bacteroidia bacterium]|nr:cysteine desulfurase family protein [Bacteroidia bacterium]